MLCPLFQSEVPDPGVREDGGSWRNLAVHGEHGERRARPTSTQLHVQKFEVVLYEWGSINFVNRNKHIVTQ